MLSAGPGMCDQVFSVPDRICDYESVTQCSALMPSRKRLRAFWY